MQVACVRLEANWPQVASPLELEHCSEAELLKALGVPKVRPAVS